MVNLFKNDLKNSIKLDKVRQEGTRAAGVTDKYTSSAARERATARKQCIFLQPKRTGPSPQENVFFLC